MKEMHPTQQVALKLGMLLMHDEVPVKIAMSALATVLIVTAKEEGFSKAEILNKIGHNIDTIEGKQNESGYW